MLDSVMKYREHLATLVLFVVATNIVVAVVRVFLRMPDVGLTGAMLGVGDFMGLVSVLALGCAVGACVMTRTPTKHAHLIAMLAAVLVSVGTVMAAVFFVIAMFSRQAVLASLLEAVGGLTDLLLKGGAAFALWTLVRRAPRTAPTPSTGTLDQSEVGALAPANAPTTPRDTAAGARWNSAAEAAQGARAQWGSDQAGWQAGSPAAPDGGPEAEPAPARGGIVAPTSDDALTGPPAKASKDLWRP